MLILKIVNLSRSRSPPRLQGQWIHEFVSGPQVYDLYLFSFEWSLKGSRPGGSGYAVRNGTVRLETFLASSPTPQVCSRTCVTTTVGPLRESRPSPLSISLCLVPHLRNPRRETLPSPTFIIVVCPERFRPTDASPVHPPLPSPFSPKRSGERRPFPGSRQIVPVVQEVRHRSGLVSKCPEMVRTKVFTRIH